LDKQDARTLSDSEAVELDSIVKQHQAILDRFCS
jgi:hypothetical protein